MDNKEYDIEKSLDKMIGLLDNLIQIVEKDKNKEVPDDENWDNKGIL